MPNDLPSDARAKAVALVQLIADQAGGHLSNAQLAPIIRAVAEDFEAAPSPPRSTRTGSQSSKHETRVLAEAVIAITDTADSLAPALKAVKDER